MSKTNWITMTGYLEYARVFEENIDNHEFHQHVGGQYNVNFYPETEEDIEKFFDAGAPKAVNGHKTLKEGTEGLGLGKYFRLKRNNNHPTFENYGGAPKVFDFTEGESTKRWTFEDGELGNGTKAVVKVSVFKGDKGSIVRLERLAVLEHVAWEREEFDDGVDRF